VKQVLVVAPHPDDETLGCGGTLLRHKSDGDKIHWLILTNISEEEGWPKKLVNARQKEVKKVMAKYGFSSITMLDLITTKLDIYPISDIIGKISIVFNNIKPNIIYLNHRNDIHTDHQIAFKAVISCTKNFRYPFISRILMYETLSETDHAPPIIEAAFLPNVFINVTDYFEKKCEIMKLYENEMMPAPFPRSIDIMKSLAKYRGSHIGKKYAEAFMLVEERVM
jgi:N-acetylglucosamine malate deacetylase 1